MTWLELKNTQIMPVDFDDYTNSDGNQVGESEEQVPAQPDTDSTPDSPTTGNGGLSQEEYDDPNRIRVTVSNPAPLIVLFGPRRCGKTMTLVRMARFLKSEGYTIAPVRTFRPAKDTNYGKICDTFNETVNSDDAAKGTDLVSFMLAEVLKEGRTVCQILEAPGEHYFDLGNPNNEFPRYVNEIINSKNRKVWAIIVEPDWENAEDRRNYVTKITRLRGKIRSRDNTVFVFNKVDRTNFFRTDGSINVDAAMNHVKNLYPGIFAPFLNKNPITRFFRQYNCDFVPFQTGHYYTRTGGGGLTYQEGPPEYCVRLWKTIMKKIRG